MPTKVVAVAGTSGLTRSASRAVRRATAKRVVSKAFYSYRLLARFAEVLPASAIRPLSQFLGKFAPKLNAQKTALVRRNLVRAMQRQPTTQEVSDTFASYIRYWLEALRLPVVPSEQLAALVSISGIEWAEAAKAEGKGIILAVPHLGNWDIAGAWFAKTRDPLTVVVEKLEPPKLRQWFHDFRTSLGMKVLVNDGAVGAELLKALARNEVIALLCDRDVDGTGIPIQFLGETTSLPKGPAALAYRSGATIIPAAVYEMPGGKHQIYLGEPVRTVRTAGSLREDVASATQILATRLEDLIRRGPTQWHMFQPNWPSDK